MNGEIIFRRTEESDLTRPPMEVTLWLEGERVEQLDAISVECDGDDIEILTTDGEETWQDAEWDDLVIQYKP